MRREPLNRWAWKPTRTRSAHTGKGKKAMENLSRVMRANYPFCQVCQVRPSTEVHHFVKWKDSVVGRLDARNFLVCCRACHEQVEKNAPA